VSGFFSDSLQEEAGFEPSVPRDTTKFSTPAHVTSASLPARGKVGANENRHHEDAGRLPRDRWFESGSLQRLAWLGEQPADVPELKALLAPCPSDEMICWPVSARVGNVKSNDPSLTEPIAGIV
jgi:hypothetical protein